MSSLRLSLASLASLTLLTAGAARAQTSGPAVDPPPAEPAESVAASTPAPLPPTPVLKVGGGAILWYYQPFLPEVQNNLEVFFANIILDANVGDFSFHLEPRFRESKLRPFFSGPAWVQEAYGAYTAGDSDRRLTVKAGKVYSQFGLFWDNSFYGNVQVYDGLKLSPHYGLSAEAQSSSGPLTGRAFLQYFLVDGQTNVSLPGRETFSIPGARRRNETIARVEPTVALGSAGTVALGVSAEYLQADLPVVGKQDVFREGADLTWSRGGATLWGEVIFQQGQSVTEFPIPGVPATATTAAVPGQASKTVRYGLAGGQYSLGPVTARYVASVGNYADQDVTEWLHVPSLGVNFEQHLSLLGELVLWRRQAPGADSWVDRSFNVTLYAHF
jgi:hypothetical protein